MTQLFVGDTGTQIILDCVVDISTATLMNIVAKKPNGVTVTWTATLNGTTAVQYITQATDIDTPGMWRMQAYVEMPGWNGRGAVATINVGVPL